MNTTKLLVFLIITILTYLLSSCVTVYRPVVINSPVLQDKGEGNIAASIGLLGDGLYNLQSAYAVSDKLALMLNGMHHAKSYGSMSADSGKIRFFSVESGVGYFRNLNPAKSILFQCYTGPGLGRTKSINTGNSSTVDFSAYYASFFVQPGIAYTEDNFDAALDIKANYLWMYDIHGRLYSEFEFWNTESQQVNNMMLHLINLEPAITIRGGGKKIKGVFQSGLVIPLYKSKNYLVMNQFIKTSVGIYYTFNY